VRLLAATGAFALLKLAIARKLELLPIEAYSWMWSQHPQLGYFDHPALTSWIVRASTALAGHSFLGVRALTVACSIATVWLVFDAVQRLWDERTAEHVALLVMLLPITAINGAEAVPDSPLLLFWSAALWAFARALTEGRTLFWQVGGLFLGLALDSKYHAAILALGLVAFLALSPDLRGWLRRRELYLSALVALAVFYPTLLWNADHGFRSFLYQGSRVGGQPFTVKELGNFLLTQFLMVTPVVFAQACAAGGRGLWRWRESPWPERLLVAASMPTLLLFAAVACVRPVRANWPAPGYLGVVALAGIAAVRSEGLALRLQQATLWTLAVGYLVVGMWIQVQPPDASHRWLRLAHAASLTHPDFVIASDYHLASELGYSNPRVPTFDLAPLGLPSKSFRDWWHPHDFAGQHAVIVMDSTRPVRVQVEMKLVALCFERIGEPRQVSIPSGRGDTKSFTLFDAWGYRGQPVAQPHQLELLPGEVDDELSAGEISVLRLAGGRHAVSLGELGIGQAGVTHHERARRRAGDHAPEETPERPGLAEAAYAPEAGVARDAAPPQLSREWPGEQRERERLRGRDARARDRGQRLVSHADPGADASGRLDDPLANPGQEMHMLVPVDEVGRATECGRERVELGTERPLGGRAEPAQVSIEQGPPERALAGQGEMEADVDRAGKRRELPRFGLEARPDRHAAHGRQSAQANQLADRAADSRCQTVVVGAEHDPAHQHGEVIRS
jgi:dolichyl-phosphate-mannose-protein mannosyltransferase